MSDVVDMSASGVTYQDKVVGGGEKVGPGLLVAISYEMSVDGEVRVCTFISLHLSDIFA